ncbi:MAG: hypothetical protein LBL36_06395 [Clostridiales Family XIII bacterium]|nr:hypothetical protein [Clostridiales Family XIII bacterium]
MRIRKHIERGSRGSLSVEAAIMLPVFLLAMLTLGIFIRMASVSESLTHSLTDELGRVAADGQESVHATSFTSELTRRAEDENAGDIVSAEVAPFAHRVSHYSAKSGKTYGDLIGASVTSGVNLGWPNMFGVAPKVSVTAVCRAFTGVTSAGDKMPLSELEEGADSNIVWVFPRAGEKYHAENCSVIKSVPKEVLLSAFIRGAYTPCELCDPGSAPDGSLVYIFSAKAYHRGNCFLVERFIIAMDRDDAKTKGYTACAKCGGG